MWSPPQLLPIKQNWHFRARQRRWLPALEVSIWPLSQRGLPSPSPLTSVDPDGGPHQAHCHPARPQWGHSGALQQAPLEALPPPPLERPGPQPSPVWVGGLAVVKAAGSQGDITESRIVDRGHGTESPHVTGLRGALPTLCPLTPPEAAPLLSGPHLRTEQQGLSHFH